MQCVVFALVIVALVYNIAANQLGRIFRGRDADVGQFKSTVVLLARSINEPANICGGAIIAEHWVLTAAHCIHERVSAKIYLGAISRDQAEVKYKVGNTAFFLHPEFIPRTARNDIALIRIPKTSECDNIRFARIPQPTTSDFANKAAMIMGWGIINNKNDHVSNLQWGPVKTMSNEECSKTYRSIVDSEICTNTKAPFASPCAGDSGGPLVLSYSEELIGVVSNVPSLAGCESGVPAVSMRVLSYLPWISEKTGISF